MSVTAEERRQQHRSVVAAFRERRRHGRVLVPIEVAPAQLAALERLALLEAGERDKPTIARAVERFLDGAAHVAALGDALWPVEVERSDGLHVDRRLAA